MPPPTPTLLRLVAPVNRLALSARVAVTVGLWLAALVLSVALAPFITRSNFLFFWLAVIGAAWWVGLRGAVISALVSILAVNYLFVPPTRVFRVPGISEFIQFSIFLLVASALSALIDRLRAARQQLQDDARRMAALNLELQQQATTLERQATRLEEQNVTLRALAEAADGANRAKADFLATMSHELRTPINAAMGYVEVLETALPGPVNDAQLEVLERIRRSQRRLLTLVTDVLSFARLESSRLELHPHDVRIAELLPEVEEYVGPLAVARGVRYACTLHDPSLVVHADHDRLGQILLNLVGNAIKFTDAGGDVAVTAEGRGHEVRLVVRDTGRGIPASKLEAIFEPFVQVDQGLTRTAEGTGLGLAISRGLARAMGGDITVESVPGAGSAFTLTLPRVVAAAATAAPAQAPADASRSSMVTGDAEHSRA